MTKKKTNGRKRAKYDVDLEALVKHWTLASSLDEACERTGLPRHVVQRLIASLRAQGVPLKTMRRARVDVKRLTEIVKETERT